LPEREKNRRRKGKLPEAQPQKKINAVENSKQLDGTPAKTDLKRGHEVRNGEKLKEETMRTRNPKFGIFGWTFVVQTIISKRWIENPTLNCWADDSFVILEDEEAKSSRGGELRSLGEY